jgi:hypothetical protein
VDERSPIIVARSTTPDHQMIGLKHEALRAGGDECRSSTLDL